MGSPRQIKANKISQFQNEVASAQSIVLAEYKGLTVKELQDLRIKLREVGAHLRVIKNTLARVAFHNLGIDAMDKDLGGQVAFVVSTQDPISGTKVASDFARRNELFVLRSGWFNGQRLTLEEVKALASMPSRDELRARFVGLLSAPVNDFVCTLMAPLQEFLATLQAKASKMEKPEFSEEPMKTT